MKKKLPKILIVVLAVCLVVGLSVYFISEQRAKQAAEAYDRELAQQKLTDITGRWYRDSKLNYTDSGDRYQGKFVSTFNADGTYVTTSSPDGAEITRGTYTYRNGLLQLSENSTPMSFTPSALDPESYRMDYIGVDADGVYELHELWIRQ